MKGNEGMEWHLHLNSTFHLLWAPKRFTNPAEQNHLRKILQMIKALLYLSTHSYKHFTLLAKPRLVFSKYKFGLYTLSTFAHVCRYHQGRGAGTLVFLPLLLLSLENADFKNQSGFTNKKKNI